MDKLYVKGDREVSSCRHIRKYDPKLLQMNGNIDLSKSEKKIQSPWAPLTARGSVRGPRAESSLLRSAAIQLSV
jgi:hypothetical protein